MEPVIILLLLLLIIGLYGIKEVIKDRKKKSDQLALALAYETMVMKHRLEIEHVEVFDLRIIALDRKHKMLLFFYQRLGYYEEVAISLLELTSCSILESHDESGSIRALYLQMVTSEDEKGYNLCFYDEQGDKPASLLSAMRRARYWKQRIEVNRYPGAVDLEAEYVF
jgi:hypothetical protein